MSSAAGAGLECAIPASGVISTRLFEAVTAVCTGAAVDGLSRSRAEWTGLGVGWLRSLLGKQEWFVDCLNIQIRL